MTEQISDLQITVDGLETERDYYFHKLREIEILTQTLLDKDQSQNHQPESQVLANGITPKTELPLL